MKLQLFPLCLVLISLNLAAATIHAGKDKASPETPTSKDPSSATSEKEATTPDATAPADALNQAELEEQFKETLTNATFIGRWCLVKDGELGPEQEERYDLRGVSKLGEDIWIIQARIRYGEKDVTVPIPVHVKWAGDTPVISITDLGIPGLGTYTARVVIYDKTYAGTWSGGRHGGLLHGIIQKADPSDSSK